ncbi:MAG TPA: MFS transporter [Microlunatus sp.]|nr:MFS transporter [Microlunatus sp.]
MKSGVTRVLGSYAVVLADPRARAFTLAGLLARLPLSMTGLGVVLMISLTTGSFGAAGLVMACSTLTSAVVLPWWGRRIDRVGQARVLIVASILAAIGLTGIVTTVSAGLPLWLTCLAAVVAGLGATSAGSCVRARWTYRLGRKDLALLNTAYALEAVFDEVVFIVGPVLVTFLATAIHPAFALGVVVVLGLAGALTLAAQRVTEPPIAARGDAHAVESPGLSLGFLVPVMLACAALGALFGGMEVVVVAFSRENGILPYSGVILMLWATGSLVAGVVTGTIVWRATPRRRFRVSAVLLAASVLPLLFVDQPIAVAGLLLLSGLAVAPTLISSVALTQASVPSSRLTEALGWTSMGMATGVAVGAAALGRVIDGWGADGGFAAMVVVALLLVAAVMAVRNARPVVTAATDTPAAAPDPIGAGSLSR